MQADVTYFLSSMDSARFESVRECVLVRRLRFDTGKSCALVRLSPPVNGQEFNVGGDIKLVILAERHEGETLFPIGMFPCFVFIARPLRTDFAGTETINKDDVEIMGSGELYRSRSDAEDHLFD
jgi:hypothetical protein